MMRRLIVIVLAFAAMVLFIEGLATALAWWRGEIAEPDLVDALLVSTLPLIGWLWWREYSLFRRDCPACRAPGKGKDCR